MAKVKALVKDNPDLVFSKDKAGYTPLDWAAYAGRKEIAAFLRANKADVNATTNIGETSLMLAVYHGHQDVVELLIANGAMVSNIYEAAGAGDLAKVKAFLKDNPDLALSKDEGGLTALCWAASNGRKEAAELLLANKADVNAEAVNGWTPLRVAAIKGLRDMAELLLIHGADVNAKDKNGSTPLNWAAWKGYKDVVELLRQHGGKELEVKLQEQPYLWDGMPPR